MAEIEDSSAYLEEMARAKAIFGSFEEVARAVLDSGDELEKLQTLVRVTVEFHDYLLSIPPWPAFPEDPLHDLTYMVDKILIHIDSFRDMIHAYGILVGKRATGVNWNAITAGSLKSEFLASYDQFLTERNFQKKYRLLLDLYKMQIVYAGMFYDSVS